MKKLLVFLAAMITVTALLLTSCNFGGNTDGTGGSGGKDERENLIYSKNSDLHYFISDDMTSSLALKVISELEYSREKVAIAAPLDSEQKEHELVLGKTDRQITKTALSRLDRIEKNSEEELIFLIYSDGSSLALVWEEDKEGVMERLAVEYFIENFVKEELLLSPGVAYYDSIDLMEEYYAAMDAEYKAEAWAKLEAAVGKELTDAYKQLYSLYESKSVIWLANLYDPDICVCVDYYGEETCSGTKYCGGAGFYYSNSGRDNMGFLPDIESTTQALSFLASAGLAYNYYNSYSAIIPDEMKDKISKFFIALQEPNGYFYHPQWGIEFTDTKLSRRARDLNSATTVLRVFGKQPIYDTPNGVKGSGSASPTALTNTLGGSAVSMVSQVVLAADVYASHLQDVAAFKEYLNSLDIANNSYAVGNELTSQCAQIIERDKALGTENDPTPLMSTLIEWLNYHQKDNGGWDDKKPGDPGYQSAYYASNGLLKISGIYSNAQTVFPNAKVACETAITATLCDSDVGSVVELYNTWYAIQVIVDTLRLYGDESDEALADEIVAGLRVTAVEAIKISREKDSVFFKDDGSASYGVNHTSADSQGCPVAIAGTNEGDVNATIIALTGIIGHSMEALEISEYKVPIFGEYERMLFFKTIDELSPIVKRGEAEPPAAVDFESDEVGKESVCVETVHLGEHGRTKVLSDPTGSGKGNVLELVSVAGKGDYVKMRNETVSGVAKVSVFEGDFYIINSSSSYSVQILMENQYMLSFRTEGDSVRIVEVSSGNGELALEEDLLIPAKMRQWFSLKIEYYYDVHGKVRIKVYADTDLTDSEEMKLYAVTDNYYDAGGAKFPDKVGKPYKEYHGFSIYAMSGVDISMYLDNLNCYKINKEYTPALDPNDQPAVNVDSPDREQILYDFGDGAVPSDFILGEGGFASVSDGALKLTDTADHSSFVSIPVNVRTATANAAVSSFDIFVPTAIAGESYLRIKGMEGGDSIFGFVLKSPAGSMGKYLTLVPENEFLGEELSDVKIPVGEKTRVTLAYYHGEDAVLVYINGEFAGATDALYKNGFKRKMKQLVISELGSDVPDISVDNITVEKIVSSFESEVTSESVEKIYDFETEDSSVVIRGSGASRVKNGDYEMRLSTSAQGSSVFLPVNNRSKVYTAAIAELTFSVKEASINGNIATVAVVDDKGDAVAAFALFRNGNKIEMKQVGVDGAVDFAIADFPVTGSVTLRMEVFLRDGVAVFYKDGEAVCMSAVMATDDTESAVISGLMIESGEVKSTVAVDEVRVETMYKLLGTPDIKDRLNPEVDTGKGLDFESSTLDSIPRAITSELRSVGAFVDVKRVYNAYRKAYSNVLRFNTEAGNNDALNINAGEDTSAYKGVVFEADIKLDYKNGNPTHRITFSDASGKNVAYMLLIHVRGGMINIQDTSNIELDDGFEYTVADGISVDDWFNLRIEYYYGNRSTMRIRILINGEVVAVSNNFAGAEIDSAAPASVVEKVNFYSMGATVGTLNLDNVILGGLTVGCNDKVTVESPK